jgi:hypothetical protein
MHHSPFLLQILLFILLATVIVQELVEICIQSNEHMR